MTQIFRWTCSFTFISFLLFDYQNRSVWWFMVFHATFNNISVISWRPVLLVEETRASGKNHRPAASQWQSLSHNVVSSTPRRSSIRTTTLVMIGIDCIGSYKSNYHTIMATMAPKRQTVLSTSLLAKRKSQETLFSWLWL